MEIVFCDNHVLVVSKLAGISTQPHLADQAKAWVKKEYKKPGDVFLEPIHRLDKPVSGLVLFARTSKALSRLQEQMRQRQIGKTYVALVEGTLPSSEAVLEHFLVHDDYKARVVTSSHPQAKLARLHYTFVQQRGAFSLVQIHLETGRYHQIRAQFSSVGCPVVGDVKYGSCHSLERERIALHHECVKFEHPVTKELLIFNSPYGWADFSSFSRPR
jgi:23S rRNA pseudouridine1911/1915/1917 synthase